MDPIHGPDEELPATWRPFVVTGLGPVLVFRRFGVKEEKAPLENQRKKHTVHRCLTKIDSRFRFRFSRFSSTDRELAKPIPDRFRDKNVLSKPTLMFLIRFPRVFKGHRQFPKVSDGVIGHVSVSITET